MCSAYAMDYLQASPDGITPPAIFPNIPRTKALLTTIKYSIVDKQERQTLTLMSKVLSAPVISLPSQHWSSIITVHAWANEIHPIAIWDPESYLSQGWVSLHNIPRPQRIPHSAQSTWTPQQLTTLTDAKHIVNSQAHFYPTAVDSSTFTTMIYSITTALVDLITQDRVSRRAQIMPEVSRYYTWAHDFYWLDLAQI
jgi:hypothetical protein